MDKKDLPFDAAVVPPVVGYGVTGETITSKVYNQRMLSDAKKDLRASKFYVAGAGVVGAVIGSVTGKTFADFMIEAGMSAEQAGLSGIGVGALALMFCVAVPAMSAYGELKKVKKWQKAVEMEK